MGNVFRNEAFNMTAINTDNEVAMEVMRLAGVVDEIAYHLTNVMFGDDPSQFW